MTEMLYDTLRAVWVRGLLDLMDRQRTLLEELFAAIWRRGSEALDHALREDFAEAADDATRTRVVIDQIASLTDASAVSRHADLVLRLGHPR